MSPDPRAREIIKATLYNEPAIGCEACGAIGSDENANFWCSVCDGKGWVIEPDMEATEREVNEIDADAILAALDAAGLSVVQLELVGNVVGEPGGGWVELMVSRDLASYPAVGTPLHRVIADRSPINEEGG